MDKIDRIKKQRKRELTVQYMVAVILIALLALSSLLLQRSVLRQKEGYASAINISGSQRMLSQRTTLLVHEILADHEKEKAEEQKELLLADINQMAKSHQMLTSGKLHKGMTVKPSPAISRMYFQKPLEVDRLVTEHIMAVRDLLQGSTFEMSEEKEKHFSILARGELLGSLNKVVAQYETESNNFTVALQKGALHIFISTIFLLTMLVVFLFRPMAKSVAEHESMLRGILDNIPIYMDIVGQDGTILYQSNFLVEFMGKSSLGLKCFETYRDNQQQCSSSCPLSTGIPSSGISVVEAGGCFNDKTFLISHVDTIFQGKQAMLELFQDITKQKKGEELLIKAKEAAEQASALKSDFLANMSHEIRTPMNAIVGLSELALETDIGPKHFDYLRKMNEASFSLLKIINDILDFSKIEAGKLDIEEIEFSLSDTMTHIYDVYSNIAHDKGLKLTIDLDKRSPDTLIGDPSRISQIMTNLISNALKFTKAGEIKLLVETMTISKTRAQIKFTVSDTGIGLNQEKKALIFDAFSQADTSTTRKYGGSGLGLSICKKLIELMGSMISVTSEEGRGSAFFFTLDFPLGNGNKIASSPSPDRKEALSDSTLSQVQLATLNGLEILLVEDNEMNRLVATDKLEKIGIKVDIAEDGKKALQAVQAKAYDLVLMDIQMPEMDGFESAHAIRNQEEEGKLPHLPIIAMTANAMVEDRQKTLMAGMDDHISKPVETSILYKTILKWVPARPISAANAADQAVFAAVDEQKDTSSGLSGNLPGLDLDRGLQSLDGNSSLYRKLLAGFLRDYAGAAVKIKTSLAEDDHQEAHLITHTIKGLAGNIGASPLQKAASLLEQAVVSRDNSSLDELLADFSEQLHRVMTSIQLLPAASGDEQEQAEVMDIDQIRLQLANLDELLKNSDFRAVSLFAELRSPLQALGLTSELIILEKYIEAFAFQSAREALAAVKHKIIDV
jgi:signal transduction histidine kinase/CheY-like chemotaxis protein/HPt (histidine-containing phosphotransfer) domain-containing protein